MRRWGKDVQGGGWGGGTSLEGQEERLKCVENNYDNINRCWLYISLESVQQVVSIADHMICYKSGDHE